MTVTLRISGGPDHGKPVGAGDRVSYYHKDEPRGIPNHSAWEIDNWSNGTCRVYARRPGHVPPAPLHEFSPSELGLYIGHEPGQPISQIKWGDGRATSRELAKLQEDVQSMVRADALADAYAKACARARDSTSDPPARGLLLNGMDDFMLQIVKATDYGTPACARLVAALDEERRDRDAPS